MGAAPIVADLGVRSDGRLLVADPDAARLRICDLQRMACDGRELGLASWTPAHLMPGNMFKFFLDEAGQRLYISDNGGHSLVIADATGKVLSRTAASKEVIFPNQVALYAPGEVTVADTNHYRIVTFEVAGDRVGKVLREFPTRGVPHARPGRAAPFGIVRVADGGTWVLVARDGMKDADVILFDAGGKPVKRVDLGEGSDPFAIALWKGSVVVADGRNAVVQLFDASGDNPREIRDPAFAGELRDISARAKAWREGRFLATVGMVLFPIVGIVALWRMGVPLGPPRPKPFTRPAGSPSLPAAGPGVRWVPADGEFVRKQTRAAHVSVGFFVVIAVLLGAFLYFMLANRPMTPARVMALAAMAFVVGAMGVALRLATKGAANRFAQLALGVSERGLHVRGPAWHGTGAISERGPFAWRDVYFDGRRFLAGGVIMNARTPLGVDVFSRAALESEILPRVPERNFVTPADLGWKSMKAAPASAKAAYGILVAAMLAYLWFRW
jgi:hypothetical protein